MSWTLKAGGVSAVLPNPAYNDVSQFIRRQASVPSDGGQRWIQDLCIEDQNLFVTWAGLKVSEFSQLLAVFRAASWQANPIGIDVAGSKPFPVGLAPGMVIEGVSIAPEQGYSPGDVVGATTFSLSVFLDQDEASFEQQVDCHGSLPVRFRIAPLKSVEGA